MSARAAHGPAPRRPDAAPDVPAARGLSAPRTIAVGGPTATGKTAIAVALAERLAPAELINADSRQVLRGLAVGTCAPTAAELKGIPCHLAGVTEPGAAYTVADWLEAARGVLSSLDARGVRAIVVGGTGLYIRALLDGYRIAGGAPDPAVRAQRDAEAATPQGRERLVRELLERDPAAESAVDLRNPRRVIRALELLDGGAARLADARGRGPGRDAVRIVVDAEPDLHRRFVEERSRRLLTGGELLAEVETALAAGIPEAVLEASGIGYREVLDLRAGRTGIDDAVDALIRRTLAYARAQRTFFRGDAATRWIVRRDPDIAPAVAEALAIGAA